MSWPTVINTSVVNGEVVSHEEREPTTAEKAVIVATSPLWGIAALGFKLNDMRKERAAKRAAEEAERLAEEEAKRIAREERLAELQLAEEARAREDNDIFARTNQLLALDIGGCIATIAKDYDTFTSVWEYRCTRDNLIIRTRGSDKATVCFHDSNEMMEDLKRYRWAGFKLV